jgi:hypothetical protein
MRSTANGRVIRTLPGATKPEAPVQPQQPQARIKRAMPIAALLQSHRFRLNP